MLGLFRIFSLYLSLSFYVFVFVLNWQWASWAGTSQPIYISTGYLNLYMFTHSSWIFVFVFVLVCVFVFVIVILDDFSGYWFVWSKRSCSGQKVGCDACAQTTTTEYEDRARILDSEFAINLHT